MPIRVAGSCHATAMVSLRSVRLTRATTALPRLRATTIVRVGRVGLLGVVGLCVAMVDGRGLPRSSAAPSSPIPGSTRQLVVAITSNWTSTSARVQRYERDDTVGPWRAVGTAAPARIGPKGLRWGRGLHTVPKGVTTKVEGDGAAPAGAFRLSTVFGTDPAWESLTGRPLVAVGPNDLFVEDPASPFYNRHVRPPNPATTPWELRNQMRLNDPAHRLKILVEHNTTPKPIPGAGSAIFLHIWRENGAATTAGCTALDAPDLEGLIGWLRADAKPVYVLLPQSEADHWRSSGVLP